MVLKHKSVFQKSKMTPVSSRNQTRTIITDCTLEFVNNLLRNNNNNNNNNSSSALLRSFQVVSKPNTQKPGVSPPDRHTQ